ncbi:MAG: GFA family protein [Planctomycetes bacterium]|nr:GFA family protein [Planctomycetota bacterium]
MTDPESVDRIVRGHCSCEAVTFRVRGEPRFVAVCHCDNCRRAHGAGGVEWAGYREEQFEMDDESSLSHWRTPTEATRSFCSRCGSPLFFRAPRWAGEVHIAVAAMIDDPGKAPAVRVYADRPPAWLPVPKDGLKRFGGHDGMQPMGE